VDGRVKPGHDEEKASKMNSDEFRGSPLNFLESRELSAVTFVRDYLQLDFDGPLITVYVWPLICLKEKKIIPGSSGYHEALCGLIGKGVVAAVEQPKAKLAIHFANDVVLEISLKPEDQNGPETAMLQDAAGKLRIVW
jgi:hypothetical protein